MNFEGFSDNESDLYIPEESSSSENEDSSSESERENDDNWTENLRGVRVEPSQKTLALFFQMISMLPLHQRRIIFF